MNVTARRRYPLLLLRDARGRSASQAWRPARFVRPAVPDVRLDAVQLVLF